MLKTGRIYTIGRLDHIVLWVADLDTSIRFYQALGFIIDLNSYSGYVHGVMPFVGAKVGSKANIDLRPAPKDWKPVEREKGNVQHISVIVEGIADVAELVDTIAKHGVHPVAPPDAVGGTWRVQYLDPDNNLIEMTLARIMDAGGVSGR